MTERSDTMRRGVGVYLTDPQAPPWQDGWSVRLDGVSLLELSAELIGLPDPLPPRLAQLRRLTEQAITSGRSTWEHGRHPATLATRLGPARRPEEQP